MGAWAGTGPIMTGSCTSGPWSLFDMSTAYLWAPIVGCIPDRPDCCPSSIAFAPLATTTPSLSTEMKATSITVSSTLAPSISTAANSNSTAAANSTLPQPTLIRRPGLCRRAPLDVGGNQPLVYGPEPLCYSPNPVRRRDDTMPYGVSVCPEDYSSVGRTGCCPGGMAPTSALGSLPACVIQLTYAVPVPSMKGTYSFDKPVVTATNLIYALQYQIYTIEYSPHPTSSESSGLSTGAKAGIGAGCGVLVVVLLGALMFFISRRRRIKLGIQERGRSGNSERATTTIGGAYLDPENNNDKKDNEPVVGGRAELGVQDAQVGVLRYELPAADVVATLTPSGVYVMVPASAGQEGLYQYEPQEPAPEQQPYAGYQIHH